MDMDTYMTTAVCTEKTDVLVLEMKHYERLFVKKHQRTIDAMRRRLEVKLNTRTSVLKEYDAIPLLKLLQMKLDLLHNPPPVADDKKKKKPETSVQIAEKLFFNHQGPLLDIEGPGSVFFMIRAREKSRLKLKAHQKERSNDRPKKNNSSVNGHLHSIRLPQSLIMAAQMAGAAEAELENEPRSEKPTVNRPIVAKRNTEIEIVAKQNIPNEDKDTHVDHQCQNGAKTDSAADDQQNTGSPRPLFAESLPDPLPKNFRRIQSAAKGNFNHSVHAEGQNGVESQDDMSLLMPMTRAHSRADKYKSETSLRHLEAKVAEWLRKDNPKAAANVSKLRRVKIEVSSHSKVSILIFV